MTGHERGRAALRLLTIQGSWNYERMQGIGMGYAAAPLLRRLAQSDRARYDEAVVRSAEFFNANPYLAGIALGATIRAEYDGASGEQVSRLRIALCGPLGALGDSLFWAGLLPATLGVAITAVALGGGWWPVAGFLVVFNLIRFSTMQWGLRAGFDGGMRVGAAINASRLPHLAAQFGVAAAFAIGVAAPVAGGWLVTPFGVRAAAGAAGIAVVGLIIARWFGTRFTAPRFALLALGATLLLRWVTG